MPDKTIPLTTRLPLKDLAIVAAYLSEHKPERCTRSGIVRFTVETIAIALEKRGYERPQTLADAIEELELLGALPQEKNDRLEREIAESLSEDEFESTVQGDFEGLLREAAMRRKRKDM